MKYENFDLNFPREKIKKLIFKFFFRKKLCLIF